MNKVLTRKILFIIKNELSTNHYCSDYFAKGRLNGKVAVITGSSYGIGYSIAERLGLEGAKVVISSRNQKNVDEAIVKLKDQNIQATGVKCHVSNAEDRTTLYQKALDNFGGINILVLNAGVNPSIHGLLNCEESQWDKIFDVNVKSSFMLIKEVVPLLQKNKGGKIVLISSTAAYNPLPAIAVYSISKLAMIMLGKTAAIELAKENIQVNCIAPGPIKTGFGKILFEDEAHYNFLMVRTPMKRGAELREVAGVAAFLVSDDASYITGETIAVSGGYLTRL